MLLPQPLGPITADSCAPPKRPDAPCSSRLPDGSVTSRASNEISAPWRRPPPPAPPLLACPLLGARTRHGDSSRPDGSSSSSSSASTSPTRARSLAPRWVASAAPVGPSQPATALQMARRAAHARRTSGACSDAASEAVPSGQCEKRAHATGTTVAGLQTWPAGHARCCDGSGQKWPAAHGERTTEPAGQYAPGSHRLRCAGPAHTKPAGQSSSAHVPAGQYEGASSEKLHRTGAATVGDEQ